MTPKQEKFCMLYIEQQTSPLHLLMQARVRRAFVQNIAVRRPPRPQYIDGTGPFIRQIAQRPHDFGHIRNLHRR